MKIFSKSSYNITILEDNFGYSIMVSRYMREDMLSLSWRVFSLLFVTLVVSIYFSSAHAAVVEKLRVDEITINGTIDSDTVRKVEEVIDGNISTVAIASAGGDFEAAMELGRLIRQHHATLFVSKYCLAACAQWIFVAAEKRIVDKDTVVAFLATMSALKFMVSRDDDSKVREFFLNKSEMEERYYEEIGVSKILLYQPALSLFVPCYNVIYRQDKAVSDIQATHRFYGWVPSIGYLNSVNISSKGYWPLNKLEFMQAITAGNKFNNQAAFIQDESIHPRDLGDAKEELSKTRRCAK